MAYQYPLNGGRINASISGNSTSAGAGYQLVSTGTLVLAGGNNVTLNQNANSISIAGPSLSNSNGFTFGTNGSVVTASYAGGGSVNFSAGTTSGNLASVNLSNANGVSFGLNAGTITASHNALTSQSAQALSASNGSFAFQTAGFSNANGVTFGTSAGSIMTASVNTSYAASNHSHGNPTLNLTNLSGTTASASNGLTLSLSAASQSVQTQSNIQGIIANGSTNRTGDVSFANSNGVTFGLSNNTITASVAAAGQTNQTLGLYASGNSTGQSSSSTMDARSLSISAQGGVSAGFSGGMMQMSAPAVSSLSQTGIVSISGNGNTISIGAPAFSAGASNLGNTAGNTMTVSNQIVFAGGNNITLSQTTGAGGATMSIIGDAGGGGGGIALANSQTTYTSGTANLVGSGAISVNSTTGQSYIISAPAQSNLSATGAVSISNNGNTISIGAPVQTNQTLGMYIASNSVTNATTSGTVDARSLIFQGVGNASVGISNGSVVISASGGGGGGADHTWSYFNPQDAYPLAAGQHGQATLHIQPFQAPNVQFDRIVLPMVHSNASNSSGSQSVSFWVGFFTRSDSLSLASSISSSFAVSQSGTQGSYSLYGGQRLFTIGSTNTLLQSQYYVGIISRTTSAGSNASFSQLVASQINSNFSGIFGEASNASLQQTRGLGYYSVSTTGMPSSIAFSQLRGTGSMALRQPSIYLVSQTF